VSKVTVISCSQFLRKVFNASALLLDDAFLKCVVTEVVLFSIVNHCDTFEVLSVLW